MKTIQLNSKGEEVKQLQTLLNNKGYACTIDGSFGPNTQKLVIKFQQDNNLTPDGIVGQGTQNALSSTNIIQPVIINPTQEKLFEDCLLNQDEYFNEVTNKNTIYLHHTAGGPNPYNVIAGQEVDKTQGGKALPIATSFLIGGKDKKIPTNDGKILRAFKTEFQAHHLGTKNANNILLNKQSVGIEVCNYGPITLSRDGKFLNYVNTEMNKNDVYKLDKPFRGFLYYHEYTDKQIESLKKLIIAIANKYSINVKKQQTRETFELDKNALNGIGGIYTHTNCRADKFDMSPSPKLIEMLNTL